MGKQDKLKWIYSSRNNQELTERYNQWAKDYDHDLTHEILDRSPELSVDFFTRYVAKEAKVLDAGAGTGMVGEILAKNGYTDLVAMDLSQEMLEEARKKNVYRELHQMVMGEPLDFATNSFGATICVGVLTVGHAPASSLDELVRVTRPGGYIIFTLHTDTYQNSGFKEKQTALESEGKWKLVEKSEKLQLVANEPDISHHIWGYKIT
ncbi:MAG: class I SAM-dependent methyltransferase [Dehalococcoidales bacterium]